MNNFCLKLTYVNVHGFNKNKTYKDRVKLLEFIESIQDETFGCPIFLLAVDDDIFVTDNDMLLYVLIERTILADDLKYTGKLLEFESYEQAYKEAAKIRKEWEVLNT